MLDFSGYRTTLVLYVNGKKVPADQCKLAKPNQTLLSFLRDVLRLTGSKLGCAEGGCGACTVMISRNSIFSVTNSKIQHYAVNACLMPVCAADGCHITTVEGIGSVKNGMHPIQDRMVELHGSQCGFCTPGIIVAIYALFASGNNSISHMEEHLDGNLCRCTGYRPIWDSVKSLCDDGKNIDSNPSNMIDSCESNCATCPNRDGCENIHNEKNQNMSTTVGCSQSSTADKCTSMPQMQASFKSQPNEIFPKELLAYKEEPLIISSNMSTWIKPTNLEQLISLKSEHTDAKIVVGNTEVGIETKFKHAYYPIYISASSIPELVNISSSSDKLIIGACTPLSFIQKFCDEFVSDVAEINSKVEGAILNMLRWFASTQIRNVASLSGNLVTASPISDMNPLLAAAEAKIEIVAMDAPTRFVPVKDFFQSYRKVHLQPHEVLKSIIVPRISEHEPWTYILPFKQARRREDDISIVTSGIKMKLTLSNNSFIIEDAILAFGGMAPTTILARTTAAFLRGKEWCEETFTQSKKILAKEVKLPANVPGGQPEYRCALAVSFLFKFYLAISIQIEKDIEIALKNGALHVSKFPSIQKIENNERSGSTSFITSKKPSIHGTQKHPLPQIADGCEKLKFQMPEEMPVPKASTGGSGLAVSHASGKYHCTGEAIYVDDMPAPENMLHSALVMADRACGVILSVDKKQALDIEGVVGVYTCDDLIKIGGNNELGPIFHDEEVFATKNIRHYGMVIGIVVAESLETAQLASRAVVVEYDDHFEKKPIITMEEAIASNSFYDSSRHTIISGDVESFLTSADSIVVEGSMKVGGQEHFYLETHSSLVIPVEGNEGLHVFSSTQAVDKTQKFCASAAGLPMHRVVAKTKRMGGGFGGKETRTVFSAAAAAVAARITNRPVKITLDRNVDMSITGSRHSFLAKYRACLIRQNNSDIPKLGALDIKLFNNGGASFDLSGPVMDRALFHVDGCYKWAAFRAEGIVCKTNQPPHTAFRGFGGPQGIAICEHIMDHLASKAKIPVETLRRSNMYQESDHTPFGSQIVPKTWNIPTAWDYIMESANYRARKEAVKRFNEQHKYKKRGLAMLPTKFGIAVSETYLISMKTFFDLFKFFIDNIYFFFPVYHKIYESRGFACTCVHRWDCAYYPRWNRNGTRSPYQSMSDRCASVWYPNIKSPY